MTWRKEIRVRPLYMPLRKLFLIFLLLHWKLGIGNDLLLTYLHIYRLSFYYLVVILTKTTDLIYTLLSFRYWPYITQINVKECLLFVHTIPKCISIEAHLIVSIVDLSEQRQRDSKGESGEGAGNEARARTARLPPAPALQRHILAQLHCACRHITLHPHSTAGTASIHSVHNCDSHWS